MTLHGEYHNSEEYYDVRSSPRVERELERERRYFTVNLIGWTVRAKNQSEFFVKIIVVIATHHRRKKKVKLKREKGLYRTQKVVLGPGTAQQTAY